MFLTLKEKPKGALILTLGLNVISELTGQKYEMTIVAKAMRIIEKYGGFDIFMINANPDNMSERAKSIRRSIVKKQGETK